MRIFFNPILWLTILSTTACVTTKQYDSMEAQLRQQINEADGKLVDCQQTFSAYQNTNTRETIALKSQLQTAQQEGQLKDQQLRSLRSQIEDLRQQRDRQQAQMGDLTVLSKSANENIRNTLAQLEAKDKYIQALHTVKSRLDSINLALTVNLKGALQGEVRDRDMEIKVDKTVVSIQLSDQLMYQSGSANLTARAEEALSKIAQVLKTQPELEILVEGYTDNSLVKTACVEDNWDFSLKRAAVVVRALQQDDHIEPSRLIPAGRSEYHALASNDTADGRALNRRTRILIMPKLNQFYDLLNPGAMAK